MEAFDWAPDRLLILRFGLQNVVQKKKQVPDQKPQEQQQQVKRHIGFTKAGEAVDITGDDYFNKISEMFQQSKDGKEEVKSKQSSQADEASEESDKSDVGETQEEIVGLGTQKRTALLDSIFNE